jgi:hypothetical protein
MLCVVSLSTGPIPPSFDWSIDRISDELEKIGKETVVAWFEILSRHLPGETDKKTRKKISNCQSSWCPGFYKIFFYLFTYTSFSLFPFSSHLFVFNTFVVMCDFTQFQGQGIGLRAVLTLVLSAISCHLSASGARLADVHNSRSLTACWQRQGRAWVGCRSQPRFITSLDYKRRGSNSQPFHFYHYCHVYECDDRWGFERWLRLLTIYTLAIRKNDAIANLHNSQITTATVKPFPAGYTFISRSPATASNRGNSASLSRDLFSQKPSLHTQITNWQLAKFKVKIEDILRLTVYCLSVCFGGKPLETHDQRFFPPTPSGRISIICNQSPLPTVPFCDNLK